MPRFIGGISGVSTSTNSDDGGSGVFGVEQSTYFKRDGNWPAGEFASGGTRNVPGDGYAYHTFQVSDNSQPTGVFNMPDAVGASTIEILLVGGGGGGGNYPSGNSGGAGGAGGVVYYPAFSLTKDTNYTISVGSGGAGASSNAAGTLGGDTTFTSPAPSVATAKGGGEGAAYTSGGNAGGSAGGGGGAGPNAAGTANQPSQTHPLGGTYTNYGNNSGSHAGPNTGISAGGGGAGGVGENSQSGGGEGGDGQPFPSFPYTKCGIAPLDPPQNPSPTGDHYGGGGGGCAYSPNVSNYGGLGGGGGSNNADAPSAASGNGVDGLGGGGASGQGGAGDGGDGIVLIRYQL